MCCDLLHDKPYKDLRSARDCWSGSWFVVGVVNQFSVYYCYINMGVFPFFLQFWVSLAERSVHFSWSARVSALSWSPRLLFGALAIHLKSFFLELFPKTIIYTVSPILALLLTLLSGIHIPEFQSRQWTSHKSSADQILLNRGKNIGWKRRTPVPVAENYVVLSKKNH